MSPAMLSAEKEAPAALPAERGAEPPARQPTSAPAAPPSESAAPVDAAPVAGQPAAWRLHRTRQRWFQSWRNRRRRALAFVLSFCLHAALGAGLAALTIRAPAVAVWAPSLVVTQDWHPAPPLEPQTLPVELQVATGLPQPDRWPASDVPSAAQEFGPLRASRWEAPAALRPLADGLATAAWQPQDWADSFPDEPAQAEALGPAQAAGGAPGESGPSSTFFGIRARGRSVVYIVDASGSMSGERFQLACGELQRSLSELTAEQSFFVIFFNQRAFPQFYPRVGRKLVAATPEYLRKVVSWAGRVIPQGETDPSSALQMALQLQPDAIFLLSDGKFDPQSVQLLQRAETAVPVHTICFVNPVGEDLLRAIAELTGGEFRFVP